MINTRSIRMLLAPLVGVACMAQSVHSRIADPLAIPATQQGWQVDTRTRQLTFGLPVANVPGEIPIPISLKFNASYRQKYHEISVGGGEPDPSTTDAVDYPIHAALGFSYCTEARPWGSLEAESARYVMEDGSQFREFGLTPLTNYIPSGVSGFTLPRQFGFNLTQAPKGLTSDAAYAVYELSTSSLALLGPTASGRVTLPGGFTVTANDPKQFVVVMDHDLARVYSHVNELKAWLPVLVMDRFDHYVAYTWSRTTGGSLPAEAIACTTVSILSQNSKGYRITWPEYPASASTGVHPLFWAEASGYEAPAMSVEGYPGVATLPPNHSGRSAGQQFYLPFAASMVGRPTDIHIGQPGTLQRPTWCSAPSLPATLSGETRSWHFTYDANNAEVKTITEPTGLVTTFTSNYYTLAVTIWRDKFTGDTTTDAIQAGGVSQAASTAGDVTLTRTWSAIPAMLTSADRITTLSQYFGSAPTVQTRITFDGAQEISSSGNTIQKKVEIIKDGAALQTTNYESIPYGIGYLNLTINRSTRMASTTEPAKITEYGISEMEGIWNGTTVYNASKSLMKQKSFVLGIDKSTLWRNKLNTQCAMGYTPGRIYGIYDYVDYAYDEKGFPTSISQRSLDTSIGQVTSQVWDKGKLITEYVGANLAQAPRSTTTTYDSIWGNPDTTETSYKTFAGGTETLKTQVMSRDGAGRPTSTKTGLKLDPSQDMVSHAAYDLYGRPTSLTQAGQTTTFAYSTLSRTITDPLGRKTTETTDAFGRLASRDNADGTSDVFAYYDLDTGRLKSQTRTFLDLRTKLQTWYGYDDLGRMTSQTTSTGETIEIDYLCDGDLQKIITTSTTTSRTATTTVWKDVLGQVVKVLGPNGELTETDYDGRGFVREVRVYSDGLAKVKAPQKRTFTYDSLKRLTSKWEPETNTQTFSGFNALGLPCIVTEASGSASDARTRTLTYDGLGRLCQSSGDVNANTSFTYIGNLLSSATTASSGQTLTQGYTYGAQNRLIKETISAPCFSQSIGYDYDTYGRLQTLTYPSGLQVGYDYDNLNYGHLSAVKLAVGNTTQKIADLSYDPIWGSKSKVTFASSAKNVWTPDGSGRPSAWTIYDVAGAKSSNTYAFDSGNQITQAGLWDSVSYDKAGRVTRAGSSYQGIYAGFSHDAFDNNTSQAFYADATSTAPGGLPANMWAWSFDDLSANNRLPGTTNTGVGTGWSTNDRGEAKMVGTAPASGASIGLGWDALGRLQQVVAGGGVNQSYAYAPSGMRVSVDDATPSRSRKYVYTSGGQLLSEFTSQGVWLRDVVYAGSQALAEVDGAGIHELHNDHLGTPRMVTSAETGQLQSELLYAPYGELVATKPGADSVSTYIPLTGFTGHAMQDATGLIYMRGRYYSPVWHRFVNSDQGYDSTQWNQLAYVGGNPFMATDPSGMGKAGYGAIGRLSDGSTVICTDTSGCDTTSLSGWSSYGSATVSVSGESSSISPALWNLLTGNDHADPLSTREGRSGGSLQSPQAKKDCADKAYANLVASVGAAPSIGPALKQSGSLKKFGKDFWDGFAHSAPPGANNMAWFGRLLLMGADIPGNWLMTSSVAAGEAIAGVGNLLINPSDPVGDAMQAHNAAVDKAIADYKAAVKNCN